MTKPAPSAKPLFRAIKGKARAPEAIGLALGPVATTAPKAERRAQDFYPTGEPEAIRGLLARDGDRIRQSGSVWEPAAGDGAMVREIRAAGLHCVATDIVDRGCPRSSVASFYDFDEPPAKAIITNPPYCEINARNGHGRWLRRTLAMPGWDYLALLLSWDWPAARANGLGDLLDAQPFTRAYLMRWKLDFTGEGSPPQRNAWFIWDRLDPRAMPGNAGGLTAPDFLMMDRRDGERLNQPGLGI